MSLCVPPKNGDWTGIRKGFRQISRALEDYSFYNLTASRLLSTSATGKPTTISDLTNWIGGTTNQITVTNDGDGTLTLSGPQDLHTGAGPTFADLTLSSPSNIYTLSHNSFADYVANEHIDWTNTSESLTTTGTIDAHAGKVLVEDNDTVAPDTQENGYVGVAVVDGTARLYFSSGGTMYYIDGTAVEIQAIETGNPIPWLFWFTYQT